MSFSGVPLGSDKTVTEEEAVPSLEEDSSKEDSLVDDARDSVEEPLLEGTFSQEHMVRAKNAPINTRIAEFFTKATSFPVNNLRL